MTTTASTTSTAVGRRSLMHQRMMSEYWWITDALVGGTGTMRAAGEALLPKEPRETPQQYKNRLARSFLFNAYTETVDDLSSHPFTKPVQFNGKLAEQLEPLKEKVDRQGTTTQSFVHDLMWHGIERGMVGVLVDMPRTPGSLSIAAERGMGLRPTFTLVDAANICHLNFDYDSNGDEMIASVRIIESSLEISDDGKENVVECIREYVAPGVDEGQGALPSGVWRLWVRSDEKNGDEYVYELREEGTHTYPGVPFGVLYFNKIASGCAEPCMMNLAWLNVSHWQSSSDQNNILRFARVPLLFMSGATEAEAAKSTTIGPAELIHVKDPNGKLVWVEHTGAAIKAGEDHLKRLEQQMETLGMQPMVERNSFSTATGKSISDRGRTSDIQMWVQDLEKFVVELFRIAARWVRSDLPNDFSVDIFSDFSIMQVSAEITPIENAFKIGALDLETYLLELKRRGCLGETRTIEEIMDAVEEAKLEAISMFDPNADPASDPSQNPASRPSRMNPKPAPNPGPANPSAPNRNPQIPRQRR